MDVIEIVNKKIEENRAEMISSLSELISIPSVAVETDGEKPFGEHVDKVYRRMLEMAEKEGFETFDADGYGGHIDFKGTEDGIVGVVGHLDVVPEGSGWDHDPYGGEVIDGMVYGRGTTDDKGPVVASFYGMKALRECGYLPRKTIRLILGLDEETEWKGMDYYLSKVEDLPDIGFTPDGDFPAIHGEMGILVFDLVKKFASSAGKGLELSSLKGGTASNSVADSARAVLYDPSGKSYDSIKEKAAQYAKEFQEKRGDGEERIKCRKIGKSLEITAKGISAHGAKPEKGLNAVSLMMEFLSGLNFSSEDTDDFISFYNSCIGWDIHGERLGCFLEDEPSGKLILNVGMADIDRKTAKITINVRYPVTMDDKAVYDGIDGVTERYDIGIVKGSHKEPIYMAEDSSLIGTLMDVYRKYTGDESCRPIVIGGGTYARAIENTVAFGARFPEDKELGHQKNECISIENMVKLAKIYAEAVYRLSE